MKKYLIVLLVALWIAYTGFWYVKSQKMAKEVRKTTKAIARETDGKLKIKYDEIQTAGYPFTVETWLINPRITYNENRKILIDGLVKIGIPTIGHDSWIKILGNAKIPPQSELSDYQTTWILSGEIDFKGLSIQKNGWEKMLEERAFADFFHSTFVHITDLTISMIDQDHNKLTILEKSLADFQFKTTDQNYDFFFKSQINQLNTNALIVEIQNLFLGNKMAMSRHLPHLINNDIIFDGRLSFPKDFLLGKFALVVDQFEAKNRYSVNQSQGNFSITTNENEVQGSIKEKGTGIFNADSYEKLLTTTKDNLMHILKNNDRDASVEPVLTLIEANSDLIKSVIPDFPKWGEMTNEMDIKFKLIQFNPKSIVYYIDVKKFSFSSIPVQMNIAGQFAGKLGSPELFKMHFQLKNYKAAIHDFTDYLNRVVVLINTMDYNPKPIPKIPNEFKAVLISYLRQLSDKENSDDLEMTFEIDRANFKVGTKSGSELSFITSDFMMKLSALFPEEEHK